MLEKCHFIGIGGIGMSGLAHLLMNEQCIVSGSDLVTNEKIKELIAAGACVSLEHASKNIPAQASVVYTSMVNEENPEFRFAKENNLPLLHRSDLLKMLMMGKKPLLVAGSHGKTTTSSLLSWILEYANFDPTYAIGGILLNTQKNARKGNGDYFIAEADESDGTFTKYQGFGAIITNISHEHMDFYKEESNLLNSFRKVVEQVENKQCLFWCAEDKQLSNLQFPGISYGFCSNAKLRGENFIQEETYICFDVIFKDQRFSGIKLPILGMHNALNALAVFGLCLELKIPIEKIREAFSLFKGVSRRMEKKGQEKGVLVIDDYAHHPKEIVTTVATLRKSYPWRRIVVLYQPHRYSRTHLCRGTFGHIFDEADLIFITDIYGALEKPIEGIDAFTIIKEIHHSGHENCHYLAKENILSDLVGKLSPLDILLVLGAGDITSFCQPLIASIKDSLPKLKLALIFGGRSREHEVSLLSAQSVANGIDQSVFETAYFAIDKNGKWQHGEIARKTIANKDKDVPFSKEKECLTAEALKELIECDVAFPVMHGPGGEDGKIQGFLETLGLAHMNCTTQPSAICMDKAMLKKIARYHAIPIIPFVDFSLYQWKYSQDEILGQITDSLVFPLFVKPVHLGSTIGVIKVSNEDALKESIDEAFQYDSHLIVENAVEGREIEFAIFGNGKVKTFAPGEILISGKIYDFESKYGDCAVQADPAAALPQESIDRGIALAKKAYQISGCDCFARIDFFYDRLGNFILNEINPVPGFTIHSMYPKICAKNQVNYIDLVNYLAAIGLQKKRSEKL